MQPIDADAGDDVKLKTEQVIDLLVKAHTESNLELVLEHVDALSKMVYLTNSHTLRIY